MTDDTEPIPESPPHTRRCWSYITFGDGACDCGVDVFADPEPCDECETTGTNCTAHGGRPGIRWPVDPEETPRTVPDLLAALGESMRMPTVDLEDGAR